MAYNIALFERKEQTATMITLRTVDIVKRTGDVAKAILEGEKVVVARPRNENWVIMSEAAYNDLIKRQNNEFHTKLDRGREDIQKGRGVTFTFESLEKYVDERLNSRKM